MDRMVADHIVTIMSFIPGSLLHELTVVGLTNFIKRDVHSAEAVFIVAVPAMSHRPLCTTMAAE